MVTSDFKLTKEENVHRFGFAHKSTQPCKKELLLMLQISYRKYRQRGDFSTCFLSFASFCCKKELRAGDTESEPCRVPMVMHVKVTQ